MDRKSREAGMLESAWKAMAAGLVLLLFCVPVPGWSQQRTLRLGVDEFPPYISEELPGQGLMCRIISESFALSGIGVRFVFVPWKRALVSAEAGDFLDGTPAWFATPERRAAFYVSDPLVKDSQSFFHLKTLSFDWTTVEDLKGLRIGGTLGYDYGQAFMEAEKAGTLKVDWVSRDSSNFKKLLLNRIQIFPMNTFAGYALLKREFSEAERSRITRHPHPLRREPLHLLLSKKVEGHDVLMEAFNEGLKTLRRTGRYGEILKEGGVPVEEQGLEGAMQPEEDLKEKKEQ